MAVFVTVSLSLLSIQAAAQSIKEFGSSGGKGHSGGIGDVDHPVLEAQSFVTDALIPLKPNTTRQLAKCEAPTLSTDGVNATAACPRPREVEIDSLNGARQEMLGFGFAWTDCSVSNFNRLEPELLNQVMEDLFAQHPRGNGMGMMRHTIGSSDMSGRQYSFDDNGPSFNEGEPDLELENFDLTEDGKAMVEMIQKMGDHKGDVFLFGAPWSYPGWMKHNGLFIAPNLNPPNLSSYQIFNNSFDVQYVPQAIKYFEKYIDAYAQYGVKVNGLSLMNEPLNYQGGYPCMYLEAGDAAAILNRGLGKFLKDRNIVLMSYDHNTDQTVYHSQVIQRAPSMVGAAAWHCYADGRKANYSVLEDFNYAYPTIPQFMTECCVYLPQTLGIDWEVADTFMPAVQHGASGAAQWVLATDPEYGPHSPYGGCAGCEGAIIVNSSSHYMRTNHYYMVGQFSRFIRRGGINYRVTKGNEGSHVTPNQFNTVAVKNPDESWAIVFQNNMNRTENVRLSFTGSDKVWEGVVENATLTTWLIPAEHRLGSLPGSAANESNPFADGTRTRTNGTNGSTTCELPSVTVAMPNPVIPGVTPLIPVPNANHRVEQNVLSVTSGRDVCDNPRQNVLVRKAKR